MANPSFSISGITAVGNDITFTVARKASCGSIAIAKDSVYFIAGAGCSNASEVSGTVNVYNIFAPSLAITPAAALSGAVIGTTATRSTTVTNGGNGALDTLRFYVVYPGGGIVNTSGTNAITVNSVSFTPSATSGDTLFYKIFGATLFGGDNMLSNGETVTILEPIRVVKCNTTTTYAASWGGSSTSICQTASGTSAISMATGVPNYSGNVGALVNYVDKCTPFDYTMTMTNSGTGNAMAATMYDLQIRQGQLTGANTLTGIDLNVFNLSNVRIGTTSVPASNISWTGGIMYVDLNNLFTTDPDGAGTGLEDVDGDGFYDDLYPGRSVVLRVTASFQCNLACGTDKINNSFGAVLNYRPMCGTSRVATSAVGASIMNLREEGFAGSGYVPANVIEGTPFRITAKTGFINNLFFGDGANTRYRWKIALPAGMSVSGTGSPVYGSTAASYTLVSGGASGIDTVVYTSTANALNSYSISLVFTCTGSVSNPVSIYYSLEKINNIVTGCSCQSKLLCATLTTNVVCLGSCSAGPFNYVPVVKRAPGCLGWTDYTLTTRQVESAISAYDLSKALYLDTINIYCSAKQMDTASNLHIELTLPKTTIGSPAVNKLTPIQALAKFYRSGSQVGSCTLTSYSSAASTATDQVVDFDLTSCLGALPGGSLLANDSIAAIVTYVVSNNDQLPTNDVQSATSNIIYNITGTGSRKFCNALIPEMYLVGLTKANGFNAFSASGCTQTTLGGSTNALANRFNSAGTDYASEFRPAFYVDSIVTTIPSGYDMISVRYQPQTGGSNLTLSPSSVSGRVYSYVNPGNGTWAVPRITVTNNYGLNVPITVVPNCATVNAEVINTKVFIRDFYYAYAGKPMPFASLAREIVTGPGGSGTSLPITYPASSKPDIQLSNLTGTVQGTLPTHSWDVRISNTSLSTAPYTWLAVPTYPNITVTEVKEISSGTVISPIAYGAGTWYQLSTAGVASAATKDYRITFSYTSCTTDSLKIYAGWNCASYPTDPSTYTCGKDSLYLKLDPQPSQVQLSVLRQPGGGSSVDLCTTDSVSIVVNSAQAGNLINPSVTFYPPAGFTVLSPVVVEYPLGSGNYQSATTSSLPGGGVQVNLSAHTAIGVNGLLGTANASQTYVPLGADRQAKVSFHYTTDCSYTSGFSLKFNAYGDSPCGSAAIGDGVASTTSALNITGAAVSGSAGVTINFGTSSVSCGSTTTLSFVTTPTTVGTSAGDTMVYTLPAGLSYAGNLTSGFSAVVSGGSGSPTTVKVAIPAGVPANTPINYSFDVTPAGSGCGAVNITGAYKRSIPPLTCGATSCANSSVVISSATSPNITLNKPSLNITSIKVLNNTSWVLGSNQVMLYYNNNGTQPYTANTDSVEFFCGNSTTPFAVAPLTKNLAIGAKDSSYYNISIARSACTAGDLITAKIQTTTTAGTSQCLCSSSSSQLMGVPLPLKFLTTDISVQYCAVHLEWTHNHSNDNQLEGFVIERSSDGVQFSRVASLKVSDMTYVDVTPASGRWYYRIKAIGIDGTVTYSQMLKAVTSQCIGNTISVYPNPASGLLLIVLQGTSTTNSYELIDAVGRVVRKGILQSNTNNVLDVTNQPDGVYVLRVTTDGNVHTQQVQIGFSKES